MLPNDQSDVIFIRSRAKALLGIALGAALVCAALQIFLEMSKPTPIWLTDHFLVVLFPVAIAGLGVYLS